MNKKLGCPPRKILRTILEVDEGRNQKMNQKTRKLVTIHKALHPRYDVDGLYVSRKEGGRVFTSIKDRVDTSIQRHEVYI